MRRRGKVASWRRDSAAVQEWCGWPWMPRPRRRAMVALPPPTTSPASVACPSCVGSETKSVQQHRMHANTDTYLRFCHEGARAKFRVGVQVERGSYLRAKLPDGSL